MRHENDIAVLQGHRLVEKTVIGVNALNAKALGKIEAMVAGLFQVGDARKFILVVTRPRVARTSAPLA